MDTVCMKLGVETKLEKKVFLSLVLPLVLGLCTVCGVAILMLFGDVPKWLDIARDASIALEESAVATTAALRANYAREVLARGANELHVYTDVAAKLLTGALAVGANGTDLALFVDSWNGMGDFTDEHGTCKVGTGDSAVYTACAPCFCDWTISTFDECYGASTKGCCDVSAGDTNWGDWGRYFQKRSYLLENDANDATTADRYATSYTGTAAYGKTSAATSWFETSAEVLAASTGADAAHTYETAWDRLRTFSLLAIADAALYNYNKNDDRLTGTSISFAADGSMHGFFGCDNDLTGYKTKAVSAAQAALSASFAPDACKAGKYGFDARCRAWYADTEVSDIGWSLSPPYEFGSGGVGNTMASRLRVENSDMPDGVTVGITALDFVTSAIKEKLEDLGQSEVGFMITPGDVDGADVVVAPGYTVGENEGPIKNFIKGIDKKAAILTSMKDGNSGGAYFDNDGKSTYLCWAGVREHPSPRARAPVPRRRERARAHGKSFLLATAYLGRFAGHHLAQTTPTPRGGFHRSSARRGSPAGSRSGPAARCTKTRVDKTRDLSLFPRPPSPSSPYLRRERVASQVTLPVFSRPATDPTSATEEEYTAYSVGIMKPRDKITEPFDRIEGTVQDALTGVAWGIFFPLVILVVLIVIGIAHKITGTLSGPVIELLGLVDKVNNKQLEGDLPEMDGGSKEVDAIYQVFRELYTVIRFSNDAFFAGDPGLAHKVMSDALVLFERLGNDRAVGVANNNLANIAFSRYRAAPDGDDAPALLHETFTRYTAAVGQANAALKRQRDRDFSNATRADAGGGVAGGDVEMVGASPEAVTVDVAAVGAPPSAEGGGGGPIRARVVENGGGGGAVKGTAVVLGARVVNVVSSGFEASATIVGRVVGLDAPPDDALELEASVEVDVPEEELVGQLGRRLFSFGMFLIETGAPLAPAAELFSALGLGTGDAWIVVQAAIDMQPMTEPATAARVASGLASGLEAHAEGRLGKRAAFPVAPAVEKLREVLNLLTEVTDESLLAKLDNARQTLLVASGEFEQALGEAVQRLETSPTLDQGAKLRALKTVAACAKALGRTECADFADQEVHAITNPAKTVSLLLDISGSMSLNSGPGVSRIQAAQANLLKVFDEHIYDVDTVGFLPFNHKVVAEQGFEPAKVQVMDRRVMRDSLMRGSSVAKGGTAFWDALVHASQVAATHSEVVWIIALTDGADQHSKRTFDEAFDNLRGAGVNLIIIGIDLDDQYVPKMEQLCSITAMSTFINAAGGLEALNAAFAKVAALISGGDGLAMESL